MREIDRLTQGDRERHLLARLRRGEVQAADVAALSLPFFTKIQIQTTTLCNAACTTCPYPTTSKELPMGWMEEATYARILEQIAGRGVERLSLFLMNEPTVDKRLEEFTRRARAEVPEAKVTIISNGKLLDGARAAALAAAGMGEITISVNGFTAASYGATMVGLRFERILENLRQIGERRDAGELGDMDVRVTALDLADAADLADEFAARVGLPVYVKPVTNRAGSVDVTGFQGGPPEDAHRQPCQRPFVKAYVLWNGDMLLCNCDWRRTTVFGNVHDTTLAAMWQGEGLMAIRRHHITGTFPDGSPCARCDYPYLLED